MSKEWSSRQKAIFNFVENGNGNAIVEAVAGSGKSTTIVECTKRVKGNTLFLAFNKAIAEELKSRGVNARTFHSLCYMPVTKARGVSNVETNKLRKLTDLHFKGEDRNLYGAFAQRLVGIARQGGMGCLIPDTDQSWMDIVIHFDMELENEAADLGRAIELSRTLLDESNKSNMVDFDDLLYFAVKDGISLPKFDFVFVDEAQDTNMIQRALLRKVMRSTSRMVAVGDPAQAIYGFRGADSDSLQILAKEFNCKLLPLDITYRCPQSVVNYAREWVSHIQAAPGAPQGKVESRGTSWKPSEFQVGDLVVCRTTKPLISLAYRMLKAHLPVRIMGREIGQGLKTLIQKMRANDIETLMTKLMDYTTREIEKATAKMLDSKAEAIQDKSDAILFLVEGLPEDNRTVNHLLAIIDRLFDDVGVATVLATIHKAKGLEADRVWWLNRANCPPRWVKGKWQLKQEENLCYVAVTRAKCELYTIEETEER
jgi:DNA helicase-2/ATP-dependent DNA helicase PcrA